MKFAHYIVLVIFILSVIMIQVTPMYIGLLLALLIGVYSGFAPRQSRVVWLTISIFIVGYWIATFLKTDIFISLFEVNHEAIVVLSRFSLLGFIIPFVLFLRVSSPQTSYFAVGNFRNTIYTPLIWKGIKDPIWRFLLIVAVVVAISFSFVINFGREDLYTLLIYGLIFALVNSILEEILWRGLILPRFVDYAGEKLGLIASSIGFGCYHYSIGFPWIVCALFSFFGMLMGGVAIRSKGLLPVILMHFVMNIAFALSGMIFS